MKLTIIITACSRTEAWVAQTRRPEWRGPKATSLAQDGGHAGPPMDAISEDCAWQPARRGDYARGVGRGV